MTDNQIQPAATVEQDTTEVETPTIGQPEQDEKPGNAEAAKYRRQRREVEAERDAIAEQLTAARTQLIEGFVEQNGITPAGFWASGVTVDQLIDEDGKVSAAHVAAAATQAMNALGLQKTTQPAVDHYLGHPSSTRTSSTWEGVLGGFGR